MKRRGKGLFTSGKYDAESNVLHLWYEHAVDLRDEATMTAFFDEVENRWIRTCPRKPYLLVNFRNIRIPPSMTAVYARCIQKFQPLVLGTFRYAVGADLTGSAVALGNLGLSAQANIFENEGAARDAIAEAAAKAPKPAT
jgi:hypothetical protein